MWQPNASINTLRKRAEIIRSIRTFFFERDVMEVETPALSQATVTDQHLASFVTEFVGPGFADGVDLYLQTSPEYAMKRLLAAGSGSIFQIAKAFRNEEAGRFHNPEFTLLEWYRLDFDHYDLMAEVDALLQMVLAVGEGEYISYQQAFIDHVGVDPLIADIDGLKALLNSKGFADIAAVEDDFDNLLQLIFSYLIEPKIGLKVPCFVYHYPASQASLAKINRDDPRVAERFEVYFKGVELANGFHELTDADEQFARFEHDNKKRIAAGQQAKDIDQHFIAALKNGLPDCAGVALGIDRLIMLATGSHSIEQVLSFNVERA